MDKRSIYILIQLEFENPTWRILTVESNLEPYNATITYLHKISKLELEENRQDVLDFPNGEYSIEIFMDEKGDLYFNSPFNVKNTQSICGLASCYILLQEELVSPPS